MFLFGKKKKTPNVVTEVETTEVPAGGYICGTVTVNLSKALESSGLVLMLRVRDSKSNFHSTLADTIISVY
jgi:hypothetical protein